MRIALPTTVSLPQGIVLRNSQFWFRFFFSASTAWCLQLVSYSCRAEFTQETASSIGKVIFIFIDACRPHNEATEIHVCKLSVDFEKLEFDKITPMNKSRFPYYLWPIFFSNGVLVLIFSNESYFSFTWKWKLIFAWKGKHKDSLCKRGERQFGNGR